MLCTFCLKSEPARIEISLLNLRICPNCLAAFLPASQFSALRRELNDSTKEAWIRKLNAFLSNPNHNSIHNVTQLVCLEHGVPLENGAIPGYSFKGFVPSCCDLQHLPPSLMLEILKISIGVSRAAIRGSKSISSQSQNSIFLLAKILAGLAMGLMAVYLAGNYGLSTAGTFLGFFLIPILIGKLVFHFWKKKPVDEDLDRLQYNLKFKDVLGEWIQE